ncbi:AsmA family protein [Paralcaligenes ginsengisoli]
MPRYAKLVLWGFGSLLILLVFSVVLLLTVNWNHARPWVSQQLSELVDRPVSINGDLSIQWQWPKTETGWRAWVPWPRIGAEQVVIGNPPWSPQESNMVEAGHFAAQINPLALFDHVIQISTLELGSVQVLLARGRDGQNNWSLKKEDTAPPSDWTFDLQQVALQQVGVHVEDAVSQLDLKTELDTLDSTTPDGYDLGWKAKGRFRRAVIAGAGQSAGVLSLRQGSKPFPFEGNIRIGATTIAVRGSVTRPEALAALDVHLKLKGSTMADLYPILGVALPNTPAYSTEGHLVGVLDRAENRWSYQNFKGTVGSSDLHGTLDYIARKPRSLLSGTLESKLLRFKDLGPLIGVDSSDHKAQSGGAVQPPAGKVLPVEPIHTESWGTMDADVTFTGRKILRNKDLPLDDIRAHIKLNDSVLTLDPLSFGVAGGTLASNIRIDGKAVPLNAKMTISARHLKLKKMFPAAQTMNASFGELHGDASVSARGNSIAALLGHSNGTVQALVSKGTISHLLLETAGLNVANIVIVKLFGDNQVELNCMAADFGIKNGLMTARTFKLDTKDAIVDVTGQISLADERFALDIKPENKSFRIFTLRTPLYVKGTFKNPDVGLYKGPLLARAGAAIVLGVVATPFAALLPLLNPGSSDSNGCNAMLAAVSDKPKVPSARKTKKVLPSHEKRAH